MLPCSMKRRSFDERDGWEVLVKELFVNMIVISFGCYVILIAWAFSSALT